jgi:hypothetical protein
MSIVQQLLPLKLLLSNFKGFHTVVFTKSHVLLLGERYLCERDVIQRAWFIAWTLVIQYPELSDGGACAHHVLLETLMRHFCFNFHNKYIW